MTHAEYNRAYYLKHRDRLLARAKARKRDHRHEWQLKKARLKLRAISS